MPIFYFDIVQIDGKIAKDTVGTDMRDIGAARVEAKLCLAEVVKEALFADSPTEISVTVRDEKGRTIALRAAHITMLDFDQ